MNVIEQVFADITGLNVEILKRVFILLCVINGKKYPNWEKVQHYGFETALMIEREYGWYRPSPSIHKLTLHTKEVMGHLPLPPGFYTEGAQESYNKRDRYTRLFHARKCSREMNTRYYNGKNQ